MRALIDGDILIYRAAHVAQYKAYLVPALNIAYRKKSLVPKEMLNTVIPIDIIEDEQKAYDAFDSSIAGILRAVHASEFQVYITQGKCFRHALTDTYKANRKDKVRPIYYDMLRQYAKDKYRACFVDGIEADDAMGIAHTKLNKQGKTSIICSIDKDLLTIPGKVFNDMRNEFYTLSEDAAKYFYLQQMLQGDTADNVKGIPRVGEVKAKKILNVLDDDGKPQWGKNVMVAYQHHFGDDWESIFKLNRQLLYIMREESKLRPFKSNRSIYGKQPLSTANELLLSPAQEKSASAFSKKDKAEA